jgi:hypothetical protein
LELISWEKGGGTGYHDYVVDFHQFPGERLGGGSARATPSGGSEIFQAHEIITNNLICALGTGRETHLYAGPEGGAISAAFGQATTTWKIRNVFKRNCKRDGKTKIRNLT